MMTMTLIGGLLCGCREDTVEILENPPALGWCHRFLTVAPGTVTLDVDSVRVLISYRQCALDSLLSSGQVIWATSTPTVVRVDNTGRVTGVSPGNAMVRATLRTDFSVNGAAQVTVR